jgi:hypothetical protein
MQSPQILEAYQAHLRTPPDRRNPGEARRRAVRRLKAKLGLLDRSVCCWCEALPVVPGQRYCRPCKALMNRRRRHLYRLVQTGQLRLSAIPPRRRLSAQFFVRKPPCGTKAWACRSLGILGNRRLVEHLANRGVQQGAWMSWLSAHRHHRQHTPYRRECPICNRDRWPVRWLTVVGVEAPVPGVRALPSRRA